MSGGELEIMVCVVNEDEKIAAVNQGFCQKFGAWESVVACR